MSKILIDEAVVKQALEALEAANSDEHRELVFEYREGVITALRKALAEQPSPAQRTWVGLTDEEKQEWIDAMPYDPQPRHCMILVNVIEAKLKEKNA